MAETRQTSRQVEQIEYVKARDGRNLFRVYFSDSENKQSAADQPELAFDDLDDACQSLALAQYGEAKCSARWKTIAKGKQKTKHKSAGNSQCVDRKRRARRRSMSVQPRRAVPNVERKDEDFEPDEQSNEECSELQQSVDRRWLECQNEAKIAAFPEKPNDKRIRQSLSLFRELVSEPCVGEAVCAVCAERKSKSELGNYTVGTSTQRLKKSRNMLPWLDAQTIKTMSTLLIMPSEVPSDIVGFKEGRQCSMPFLSLTFD